MNITLNNRPQYFDGDILTISEILKLKNYTFKMMVVKINNRLIKKQLYEKSKVADGDNIQIIHMISGG
jgi:thiamine biosynthesis protein ThiS